ncbi:major facilitator superfamily domain-containing protein, partial [Podospora conica]
RFAIGQWNPSPFLLHFSFFLADKYSNRQYWFYFAVVLASCRRRHLDHLLRSLSPFITTATMPTDGEKSAEAPGRSETTPRSSPDLHQTLDGAADKSPAASSSSHPYSDPFRSVDSTRSQDSKRLQHRGSKGSSDIHLEDLEAFPRAVSVASTRRDSQRDSRPISRRASIFARTAALVPKSEQRGLLARFTIIPEIESPYEYTNNTKWIITAVVAMAAAGAPMGSGIFYPALPEMTRQFNTSETIVNLTVALYMLSMSIFPLWWSSFSETLGRRTIYIVSFALFVIFSVLSALSVNIPMLIVMRMLGGGASASVQAVGAGTIADIWETSERGRAMGLFYLGPLTGPLFAPMIGGALSQRFGWRSTMWFLAIYGVVILLLLIFGLPETLPRQQQDKPPSSPSPPRGSPLTRTAHRLLIEPLLVLSLLRRPPVLISVYTASIAFGALFMLNISIQSTFSLPPYSFSPSLLGLLYLAPALGYITASLLGGRWIDAIMRRHARPDPATGALVFHPEDRMRENMWLAGSLYPAALVAYGWAAQRGAHWAAGAVAAFAFGCGSMLVFGAVTTVLTEFVPDKRSAGVAVNNFVRNIFSCVGAVVAQPGIRGLGNGWLMTAVAGGAWVTGNGAVWMLRRGARRWREEAEAE